MVFKTFRPFFPTIEKTASFYAPYLSLLLNFRALLSIDSGANLVNSKQAIGVILPDLSLLGYAVPVESFGIGLFIVLFAYLAVEYNVQLLSHEKLKIAMNMLHTTYTPLILLRNQLEELKTGNLPESLSQQVEEALRYTEYIIYCNQNIVTLNKVNKKILPKTSTANLELSSYITSIVNQCRPYADSRRIQLTVSECSDCVSCRINENIMTAALQHLISKLILGSDLGCCISINITHTTDSWQLQITNCEIADKRVGKMFPFIPVIFPIYGYSDLWTVRKIIRLHGGKINGYRHGKSFAFQIVIPTDCHCRNQECSVIKHSSTNTKNKAKKSSESDKDDTPNAKTKDTSHILLVMADGAFRNYLRKALSRYFQISVLKDPDLLKDTVVRQNPDAIIIDDNVNGTNGDALSFRIKTDKMIGYIPVVLLIRAFDNESYLSHLGSGADRLELRTESICRLRANIRMLVENRMVLRERVKLFLSDAVFPMVPTKEEMETENTDQIFMDKVNKILEKNLSTDKYTIDKLSIDIGMSRTAFYSRIREITGNPPENYIYSFKMGRALKLLASQQYTVSEIAGMLGYCDAKYFGKKFKDFYHVCPTDYIKSIIG
ncbi:helix-turn-helix domain-containing protein [Bacteroides xylanisolvens]